MEVSSFRILERIFCRDSDVSSGITSLLWSGLAEPGRTRFPEGLNKRFFEEPAAGLLVL